MRSRLICCLALLAFALTACGDGKNASDPSGMPLLSKRIFAPDPNDTIVDLMPLRTKMRAYAKTIPEPFGIYFEYLPSGASIGINEQASFIEASLLKVPVVIKAYQMENEGLLSLDDTLRMEESDIDRNYGTLWQRGVGTEISVREAVRLSLQDSDNTALQMLGRKMGSVRPGFVNEVFDNLDIPKEVGPEGVMVTAKNYTSILRSLYLAASLPKRDAQEILSMLTKTRFSDKIPAGVPPEIPVAHKVGVYDKEGVVTYADCGIIYVPKRPYSLCVFVHGSAEHATQYIKDFSLMAYETISRAEATSYDDY
ncbi:MAG: serine hydrolase [Patescibacteria group bacterium]